MKQIASVLLVLLCAISLRAQEPPTFAKATAGQPQPQKPTFRSRVQVVEVDARVFDKNGRFVADLTKEDFEVLEDGVPQTIDASYLVVAPDAKSAAATPVPAEPADAIPAAPQTWIFFFDLNHLPPGTGFERARKAVEDFVSQRFREGDLAGVVAGGKMVNGRITSVRSEIMDALKQVRPLDILRARRNELTRQWPKLLDEEEAIRVARNERDVIDRAIERACAEDPEFCKMDPRAPETLIMMKGRDFQQQIHRHALETLTSVNALANGLARVPGPKTVVLLSTGFVSMNIETTVRSVVGQTTRAGARVYAIDARGLDRARGADIIDRPGFPEDPAGALGTQVQTFDMGEDGMNSLAIDTGGMMIRNENNLGRALDTVAEDGGTYYVLAYQPANSNFDGKYRTTEVRVKRDGLRVRARRGYLALDPARMLAPKRITTTAPAPAEGPEPAIASAVAPPPPPESPSIPAAVPPVKPAAGTVTGAGGAPSGTLRMRPDAAARVRELSDTAPEAKSRASDLAQKGWEAYQRGDVEGAIGPLTEAAAQPDVRPWALYALGLSQGALGKSREAIASWERVREGAPDFTPVYIDLAATHASLQDLSSALAVLRDAEKRWPQDPEIHNAIGVIHFRRGALDEAIAAFTRGVESAPRESLAFLNLGRAYEMRFSRSGRFVTSQRRWVMDDGDRQKAKDAYEAYLKLGGPYEDAARDGLARLEWSK